jgi:hypothetical protein
LTDDILRTIHDAGLILTDLLPADHLREIAQRLQVFDEIGNVPDLSEGAGGRLDRLRRIWISISTGAESATRLMHFLAYLLVASGVIYLLVVGKLGLSELLDKLKP